jgi:hypothetical protein
LISLLGELDGTSDFARSLHPFTVLFFFINEPYAMVSLISLELGEMYSLSSASFAAIAARCPRLRALCLFGLNLSTADLELLLSKLTHLEQLDLYDQEPVSVTRSLRDLGVRFARHRYRPRRHSTRAD